MIIRVITIAFFYLASLSTLTAGTLRVADDGLSAGYVTLSWPEAAGLSFQLDLKTKDGWRSLYAGGDRATTLSGLADGRYQFRLISDGAPAPADNGLTITVHHHPLTQALAFFGGGAVIFAILLILLIRGSRPEDANSSIQSGRSHI
ncbi:hypothetical protein [Emcibacter sp.]|uniref:hypothetical protein n=1 Tax=Emcibacter sp. TaxID=1979954 RepID=UPI003A8D6B0D